MKKIALLLALLACSVSALGQGVNLKDRTLVGSVPRPTYTVNESGTVVVTVWVDKYGNVTKAEPGAEGTTTKSKALWTSARNSAMKAHFDQKADAPALQEGTITYVFKLAGEGQKAVVKLNSDSIDYEDEIIDETALKFLGIPIDGSQEFVIAQLKEKGFEDHFGDYLEGQFNGEPVRVYVHTYHDKVDRIIVDFDHVPEMSLNEQYNQLLSLLKANVKYNPLGSYSPIPLEERCENEILLRNKDYRARFGCVSSDASESVDGEIILTILNRRGYRVSLYYDNLNNRPHGEDL